MLLKLLLRVAGFTLVLAILVGIAVSLYRRANGRGDGGGVGRGGRRFSRNDEGRPLARPPPR